MMSPALEKYARIGRLFGGKAHSDDAEAREFLVNTLNEWTVRLQMPGLRDYGIRESDLDKIVSNSRGSSMKTNPVVLTDGEVREVLLHSL